MKSPYRSNWLVIALLFLCHYAGAQFYQPIMIDPSVLKFFDPNSAFVANAEYVMQPDGNSGAMPIKIAILGNRTRLEMDVTKNQGGKAPDEVMAGYFKDLKTAGSAESVSIFNPDKKYIYIVLPRLKAYLQTPIPEEQMDGIKQRPKADKNESGKAKIDGHACTKYTLKFGTDGPTDVWRTSDSPSATVWIAQDVPACPLRLDLIDSEGRKGSSILIKNVETTKVDKKLFEPPDGYTKCETPGDLIKIIKEHWPKDKTR